MSKDITIIDNDFLSYCMRSHQNIDGKELFLNICRELNMEPVVHTYVYEQEMFSLKESRELVSEGKMRVIDYPDFLKNEFERTMYERNFEDLYHQMNGEQIVYKNCDVFSYRGGQENLGEIHSILLAMFCRYNVFLSNDGGAKEIAWSNMKSKVHVYNIIDVFERIAQKENRQYITKADFVALTKGDKGRKKEINRIKELWKEKSSKD